MALMIFNVVLWMICHVLKIEKGYKRGFKKGLAITSMAIINDILMVMAMAYKSYQSKLLRETFILFCDVRHNLAKKDIVGIITKPFGSMCAQNQFCHV